MKRYCYLISLVGLFCIMLTGCASQEAKQVIQQIDSLGEVTLDSYDDLQQINQKYSLLSEKDKRDVKNAADLDAANQRYNELLCIDLNDRIALACESITSESVNELTELLDEYNTLSDDNKLNITNYELLCEGITKSRNLLADEKVKFVLDNANGMTTSAKSCLQEYSSIMTDDQILKCLIEIGRWGSQSAAEKLLKKDLKNPNSLAIYGGSTTAPQLQSDGTYMVKWNFDYGASNSFGAMVRDEVEIYVYYEVDTSNLSLNYTNAEYTAYYRFKMAS